MPANTNTNAMRVMSDDITLDASEQNNASVREILGAFLLTRPDIESLMQHVEEQAKTLDAHDFISCLPLVIRYLRKNVQYDNIARLINFYSAWFETKSVTAETALYFYDTFNKSVRYLNGRRLNRVAVYDIELVEDTSLRRKLALRIFRLLCINVEYDRANQLLEKLLYEDSIFLLKLASSLTYKPVRSEKNGNDRYQLRKRIADQALVGLRKKYKGRINTHLNEALYQQAIGDFKGMSDALRQMLAPFKRYKKNQTGWMGRILQLIDQIPALPLMRRSSQFHQVFYSLLRNKDIDTARALSSFISPIIKNRMRLLLQAHIDYAEGRYQRVVENIESTPSSLKNVKIYNLYIRALKACNRFEEALSHLVLKQSLFRTADDEFFTSESKIPYAQLFKELGHMAKENIFLDIPPETEFVPDTEYERLMFLKKATEICASSPQPENIQGVVLLSTLSCMNSIGILAPVIPTLKKRGYAVLHMSAGMLGNHQTGSPVIDSFGACMAPDGHDGKIMLEWDIRPEDREIICEGINFYQGIFESISVTFRRFTIDYSQHAVKALLQTLITKCDYALRTCLRLEKELLPLGLPVVITGSNSHVAPFSVFRDFCLSRDIPQLRFVITSLAYENYYSNLGSKYSRSMAVVDATFHKNCRAPFLAIGSRFELWYQKNRTDASIAKKVDTLIKANRSLKKSGRTSHNLEKILDAKTAGKKIICCFGKILCDQGVFYDGGPAHKDIVDWINHTIEVAADTPDTLFVIKPHPHELRAEIALDLTEYLRDVIPAQLPDNVLYLEHNEMNMSDIIPVIDAAILWNGTSALELTTVGIPVIMCGHFGKHDYPIDLIYPKNRLDYVNLIKLSDFSTPSPELQHRAAALLHYMGTKEVAIPNEYCKRPSTNDKTGTPYWDTQLIEQLLQNGDPYMDLAAERILEGVDNRTFLGKRNV